MKAEELRIGNIVEYNTVFFKVSEIRSPKPLKHAYYANKYIIELFDNGLIDVAIDEIKPIPLTEEWLLKFGFVQFPASNLWDKEDFWAIYKKANKDDNRIENLELMTKRVHKGEVCCPYCNNKFTIR